MNPFLGQAEDKGESRIGITSLLAVLAFLILGAPLASAGSSSKWVAATNASARLLIDRIAWSGQDNVLAAGIHIKLDEGWKTYWRSPGDAGLPPLFDWSGSSNLKSAEVLFPAPIRYRYSTGQTSGTSYVYKKEVVLPVLLHLADASKPVKLNLNLEYAVCDADICSPAQASLKVASGGLGFFSSGPARLITSYLDKIPVKRSVGDTSHIGVKSTSATLNGEAPRLVIDAKFPEGAKKKDVFVEGPEGYYLPPTQVSRKSEPGFVRYWVDLKKADDPSILKNQNLTITLVSDAAQAEVSWPIK